MKKKRYGSKPLRISLTDWKSFWLTLGLVVVFIAAMIGMHILGWDQGILGNILVIAVMFVFCTLLFDIGFLLTACITIADGMVNAGKDSERRLMTFHANKVVRVEVRDREGNVLPPNQKKYQRVDLIFVMESGRENARPLNALTQKQLKKIKDALGR